MSTARWSIRSLKPLEQVDVLAREGRDVDRSRDLLEHLRVLPGDHVLQPGQLVGLEGLAQPDAAIDVDVAEVVGGQRDLVADLLADLGHVLGQQGHPLVGELDPGEGGHRGRYRSQSVSGGPAQRAGDVAEQVDSEVHLQEGEALHPFLELLGELLLSSPTACRHRGGRGRGTCRPASGRRGRHRPCRPGPTGPSRRRRRRRPAGRGARTAGSP